MIDLSLEDEFEAKLRVFAGSHGSEELSAEVRVDEGDRIAEFELRHAQIVELYEALGTHLARELSPGVTQKVPVEVTVTVRMDP